MDDDFDCDAVGDVYVWVVRGEWVGEGDFLLAFAGDLCRWRSEELLENDAKAAQAQERGSPL